MSTITGDATNNDEYVPIITPTIKANMNPLITSPPKRKIISKKLRDLFEKHIANDIINGGKYNISYMALLRSKIKKYHD